MYILISKTTALTAMGCVRLGEKITKKDSICQVDVINQQNVIAATNYLEKEKDPKEITSHFIKIY